MNGQGELTKINNNEDNSHNNGIGKISSLNTSTNNRIINNRSSERSVCRLQCNSTSNNAISTSATASTTDALSSKRPSHSNQNKTNSSHASSSSGASNSSGAVGLYPESQSGCDRSTNVGVNLTQSHYYGQILNGEQPLLRPIMTAQPPLYSPLLSAQQHSYSMPHPSPAGNVYKNDMF